MTAETLRAPSSRDFMRRRKLCKKRFRDHASVLPSAEHQTKAFMQKRVPEEIEKFRKLLVKLISQVFAAR